MTDIYQTATEFVATEKLNLAARNLQHLLKIQNEQVTLDAIVTSLQQTITDAHAGVDTDFSDMLAAQTRILDATFHFYVDDAKGKYTDDDKMNMALRAQRQTQQTIMAWHRLKKQKNKNNPGTN